MNKRFGGYVFFMTLCVILVISMLLMVSMQHLGLYHKALNQQELSHQQLYQLEYLAQQLAQDSNREQDRLCLLHMDNVNQAIALLQHGEGCVLNLGGESYRYVIEFLGEFPCLVVQTKAGLRATVHRRVSIMWADKAQQRRIFMQIRQINAAAGIHCVGTEHQVSLGISSWRFLELE